MEAISADATVTLYLSNRSPLLFVQKIHFRTKPKFLEKKGYTTSVVVLSCFMSWCLKFVCAVGTLCVFHIFS